MLQSQLINLLCARADDKYGGRLPVHVRLILDEFANIGQIPNFDKLIATIRSREISASIILQSQSQLKAIYKDAAEIISDNCDSVLFLSGRGKNAKEISDALGKAPIDSFNTSENRGSQPSHGLNYQKLGKALMHRLARADFPNRKQIVHEILHPEDRPAPQSSYSHYSGINYSALEVAVRRIQQDFDFLMRYLPKLPDDSYAKTETLKILKQHKAYMAQFEEMLNDKEIA